VFAAYVVVKPEFGYESGMLKKGTREADDAEKAWEKCDAALSQPGGKDHVLVNDCEAMLGPILAGGNRVLVFPFFF